MHFSSVHHENGKSLSSCRAEMGKSKKKIGDIQPFIAPLRSGSERENVKYSNTILKKENVLDKIDQQSKCNAGIIRKNIGEKGQDFNVAFGT